MDYIQNFLAQLTMTAQKVTVLHATREDGGRNKCGYTNLNGIYPQNNTNTGNLRDHESIYWHGWEYVSDRNTPFRRVSMKVQY